MAITLEVRTEKVIGIEEFLELIERDVDPDDRDSLVAAGTHLKAVSQNKTLLVDVLKNMLTNWNVPNAGPQDTSIGLGQRGRLMFRANVWIPPALLPVTRRTQAEKFGYLVPHDHYFDFLTVGYSGSGYKTKIFEYDRASICGSAGELVELRLLESTSLPAGKMMLYRAGQDVHQQDHPDEVSTSLNLVAFPSIDRTQYLFDAEEGRITTRLHDPAATQASWCQLAGSLMDPRLADPLEEIAQKAGAPALRLAAMEALKEIEGSCALTMLRDDTDMAVRNTVRRNLNGGLRP